MEVGETECEPLVGWLPLQALLAVQELASVLVQDRVLLLPETRADGEAEMVTVGAGVGGGGGVAVTVMVALAEALPPVPVQDKL